MTSPSRKPAPTRSASRRVAGAAAGRAGVQSLETGGSLLQVLVDRGGPLMLRDLAAAAAMPAAKAHRYLASFMRLGLVEQEGLSGRYGLGPFALRMGLAALGGLDAVRVATPALADLAGRLDVTAALAVWGNQGATIVRWEESRHIVTVNVRAGGVMPLLASATGRCFAAWLPPGTTSALLAAALRQARAGPTGLPRTRAEAERLLAAVRTAGLARVTGELIPGIDALSAPVFDARGAVALALTVLGYAGTFDSRADGPVARELLSCTAALSRRLGGGPPAAGHPA